MWKIPFAAERGTAHFWGAVASRLFQDEQRVESYILAT